MTYDDRERNTEVMQHTPVTPELLLISHFRQAILILDIAPRVGHLDITVHTVPPLYLRAINEPRIPDLLYINQADMYSVVRGKIENKAIVTSGASTSYMHGRDSANLRR